MSNNKRCSKEVRDHTGFRHFQCSRNGKIKCDGNWYCTQHDPVRIKVKRALADAKWQKEDNKSEERESRKQACLNACKDIPTEALEQGVVNEMLKELKHLIRYIECGCDPEYDNPCNVHILITKAEAQ